MEPKELLEIFKFMIDKNISVVELDEKVNIEITTDSEEEFLKEICKQNNIYICIPPIIHSMHTREAYREEGIKIYRS